MFSSINDKNEDISVKKADVSLNKFDTSSKNIEAKIYALKISKTSFDGTFKRLSDPIIYSIMIIIQNYYLKFWFIFIKYKTTIF